MADYYFKLKKDFKGFKFCFEDEDFARI